MRRFPILFLMIVLPVYAGAGELTTNGGFEEDLLPAWQSEIAGSAASIDRGVGYDADPDYEVLVSKGTGNGHARLNQTIVVPSTDVDFSVNAKMQVAASTGGPWAAAGVAIHYEDQFGNALGSTLILGRTPLCPWEDSDIIHLIEAPDEEWNGYAFNLDTELLNLTGIDPLSIHQLRINLFGQSGGDC